MARPPGHSGLQDASRETQLSGQVMDADGNVRGPKVAVCMPAHDQMPSYTAYDLAGMLMHSGATLVGPGGIDSLGLNFVSGTYVHRAREELAEVATQAGADFILWVDSDMRFPRDALARLLLHGEDMVGINYSKRGLPPEYVAVKDVGWNEGEIGEPCVTGPDSEGLEKVEAIGFGLVLMRTHIFAQLADEKPWFWYEDGDNGHVGEDVYFCRLVNEAGFDIYVDHDLSKECSHIGTFEYETSDVATVRDAIEAEDD